MGRGGGEVGRGGLAIPSTEHRVHRRKERRHDSGLLPVCSVRPAVSRMLSDVLGKKERKEEGRIGATKEPRKERRYPSRLLGGWKPPPSLRSEGCHIHRPSPSRGPLFSVR